MQEYINGTGIFQLYAMHETMVRIYPFPTYRLLSKLRRAARRETR